MKIKRLEGLTFKSSLGEGEIEGVPFQLAYDIGTGSPIIWFGEGESTTRQYTLPIQEFVKAAYEADLAYLKEREEKEKDDG